MPPNEALPARESIADCIGELLLFWLTRPSFSLSHGSSAETMGCATNQPSRQPVNRVFCHDPDDQAVMLNTDSSSSGMVCRDTATAAHRQGEEQLSRYEVFTTAASASGAVLTVALEHSAFTEETAGPDPGFDLIAAEADEFARFNAACGNTEA